MDVTRIIELQRALLQAGGVWNDPEACRTLEDLLRTDRLYEVGPNDTADGIAVMSRSMGTGLADGIAATFHGYDTGGFSTFVDPYASFLHRVLRSAGAGAFHDGPLFDPAARENTEVHAKALNPNQIDRQMAASTPLSVGEGMLIAGYGHVDVPGEGSSEFKWLKLLEPAFTAGRKLRAELQRYKAEWVQAMDAMPVALLVFDAAGTLMHRNHCFDALAATQAGLEDCQTSAAQLVARVLPGSRRDQYMAEAPLNVVSLVSLPDCQVRLSAAQAPWPHGDPICLVSVEVISRGEHYVLTPRETEVAKLLAEGHQDKQIARDLDISLHTARRHVERVLSKTGCRNRTEAALKLRGLR
ncbi:helix-turn-helix transcriptional regulator [Roseobacter sp. MH60115]|uniref:helix-turn-helix transcriptional regulator n=1 Tax=Roseobacter sp. MH60115 TaxID=2785324 RepID=UPI001E497CAC|nr:helix-turn-helix transcriptional regulator [Roseobacter sp. MH60115]